MELRVWIEGRVAGTDLGRPSLSILEAPTVPERVLRGALRERDSTLCRRMVEGEPLASFARRSINL